MLLDEGLGERGGGERGVVVGGDGEAGVADLRADAVRRRREGEDVAGVRGLVAVDGGAVSAVTVTWGGVDVAGSRAERGRAGGESRGEGRALRSRRGGA